MIIHEKDTEREILDQALQAVRHETGLRLHVKDTEVRINDYRIDALVQIEGGEALLAAEVKKWAQQANFGALVNQIQRLPQEGLLVADYVNPRMAEKLRDQGVQFIDTAGNAYINQPPVYVYVTGKKQEQRTFIPTAKGAKRAFEPKGLMVVYAFLCNPNLVNAPYREIAGTAGVAVGTVGWVLNGLVAANFIRVKGKKIRRHLINYRGLLDRWVEAYPEKLRPKLTIGEFTTDDPNWWKDIDIQKYNGYWGGEIAAAKYTDYLKPKVATVYLPEDELNRFLRNARLRKVTNWLADRLGPVEIYRPFWPRQLNEVAIKKMKGLVHPLLAYADLVASGDPRNLEVARRIYDEQLAQYNREG